MENKHLHLSLFSLFQVVFLVVGRDVGNEIEILQSDCLNAILPPVTTVPVCTTLYSGTAMQRKYS